MNEEEDCVETLMVIGGTVVLCLVGHAVAEWKVRRAVKNTFYMVRPKEVQ